MNVIEPHIPADDSKSRHHTAPERESYAMHVVSNLTVQSNQTQRLTQWTSYHTAGVGKMGQCHEHLHYERNVGTVSASWLPTEATTLLTSETEHHPRLDGHPR